MPSLPHSSAVSASKTAAPVAAPGEAGNALPDRLLLGVGVDPRVEELLELARLDAGHRLLLRDHALLLHRDREPDGGLAGPLGVAGLEHVELAALDRELEVLDVLVVGLQLLGVLGELLVDLGHRLLEARDRLGVPDAGDDVLALRVGQVVAVELLRAGDRVAGEGDAGARSLAHVAEDHGLDVDGGAEVVGDLLRPPVGDRAVGVPGAEDGLDGRSQLIHRVVGKFLAGVGLVDALEDLDDLAQVLRRELRVGLDAGKLLGPAERFLEDVAVDALDDLAEHLDEAAVGVEGEPLVTGEPLQPAQRVGVQAQVEDRVHHPGHRELGPRADAHQERVGGVAEALAGRLLDVLEGRRSPAPTGLPGTCGRRRSTAGRPRS